MTGVQLSYTEADKAAITERMRELAHFADGDKVTVEPTDHDIAYAGRDLEGALLTVDDVFWNSQNLTAPTERTLARDSYGEEHKVWLADEHEHYAHDAVVITGIEYTFKERGARRMSESALIPWEEYRAEHDRIKLPNESLNDSETHWLEPFEEPCDVCGCNMAKHWHFDNGVQSAGGYECAACGDVKEQHAP